jgi:hypothetical protein
VLTPALAAAVAVTFVWLGMVLAISFLEAPLKFRAPGVDLRIGLGIGRLVFRAPNAAEAALAAVLVITVFCRPRADLGRGRRPGRRRDPAHPGRRGPPAPDPAQRVE